MAKPEIHAKSSARKYGGKPEDYMAIHEYLDSVKACFPDNRGRAFTHNSWFIEKVLPDIFGRIITNSDGKEVSVRYIGEQHVLEDYGLKFIPTPQDWLKEIQFKSWMQNGQTLPSSMDNLIPTAKSFKS